MLRRSFRLLLTVHSPRAVPFAISPADAVNSAKKTYSDTGILGASTDYIEFKAPSAEFMPFFLCHGEVQAKFTASVSYTTTVSHGKSSSIQSNTVETGLLTLRCPFHENTTQIYAGYKFNSQHVTRVLRDKQIPLRMQKAENVDLSHATINLFEASTTTLNFLLNEELKPSVIKMAKSQVKRYHPDAESMQINFRTFEVHLREVYPVFLPCYVIPTTYDENEYNTYVNGHDGRARGPYLLNALAVGRAAGITTLALFLLLSPSKAYGFVVGSVASVVAYYVAFAMAQKYPSWRRDRYRKQRAQAKMSNTEQDATGFKPTSDSQRRVTEEYRRSSFWSTHSYDQKQQPDADKTSTEFHDPKGFYKILGLSGGESVNEIRSAYRKMALSVHPDAGGSNEKMQELNEAYRTLRDPELRRKYDEGNG